MDSDPNRRLARPGAGAGLALAATAACLLLLAGCSAGMDQTAEATFRAADRDGSGALTPAEVAAYADQRFDRLDLNGDGELDLEELGLAGLPLEARTLPFDLDGNGRMSRSEHLAFVQAVIRGSIRPGGANLEWVDVDRRLVR